MNGKRILLLLTLALALLLCGNALAEKTSTMGFYFDTVVTFTYYDADDTLATDMHAACARYENLLSKTVEGSDVWRINHANGETVTVDEETWDILRRAKEISDKTGHAYSVTIGPLTALWDFTGGTERMPTVEEAMANVPLVNDDLLELGDDFTVTLPAGMQIDLGGIAKGYIADKMAEMARGRCSGALINLGGNVYVIGQKPDGSRYNIGINNPFDPGSTLLALRLTEGTVVTSGTYERYFVKDGVTYHHILDPKTGYPADTGIVSISIVTDSSMDADAFATACIVLGREGALELLNENGLDGLIIESDGTRTATEGFEEKYDLYEP